MDRCASKKNPAEAGLAQRAVEEGLRISTSRKTTTRFETEQGQPCEHHRVGVRLRHRGSDERMVVGLESVGARPEHYLGDDFSLTGEHVEVAPVTLVAVGRLQDGGSVQRGAELGIAVVERNFVVRIRRTPQEAEVSD